MPGDAKGRPHPAGNGWERLQSMLAKSGNPLVPHTRSRAGRGIVPALRVERLVWVGGGFTAALPVVAIPILMGGVSLGQLTSVALALVNIMFLSRAG